MSARLRTSIVALLLVGLLAAAGVTLALPRTERAQPLRASATGALELTNSRDGQAVFKAANVAPGEETSGQVTIGNAGTATGALSLEATPPTTAGPGTQLPSRLMLSISDVTGGAAQQVYSGPLAATPAHTELLELPPGGKRSYRFDVVLPDGGSGPADNLLQGTAVSVDYQWGLRATEPSPCGNLMRGTMVADVLVGTGAGDRIAGLWGDDRADARAGDDCVEGDGGADRLSGQNGADALGGGPGADVLLGGPGEDALRGGPGADVFNGGPAADEVKARGGGSDRILCDAADQVFAGINDVVSGCTPQPRR